MNYILIFFFLLSVYITAQEKDSMAVTHLPGGNSYECIDNIYNDPEAVKQLLQRLISDKENFKQIFQRIINDPEMKNAVKEIRDIFREDRGMMDTKKNTDLNKTKNEMTYLIHSGLIHTIRE